MSFQKSNISWPQQPPAGKTQKINLIFYDSTKINFVSKHQNKAEFENLVNSEVLGSTFSGLRTSVASVTLTASTTSVAWMTSTASFHQKIYCSWWFIDSWHQNDQYWSIFAEWIFKKPIFTDFSTFSVRGCWEQPMLLFWFMKLKIYNLLKPLGTITQLNYWYIYPSELIYSALITMRHPVGFLPMVLTKKFCIWF